MVVAFKLYYKNWVSYLSLSSMNLDLYRCLRLIALSSLFKVSNLSSSVKYSVILNLNLCTAFKRLYFFSLSELSETDVASLFCEIVFCKSDTCFSLGFDLYSFLFSARLDFYENIIQNTCF